MEEGHNTVHVPPIRDMTLAWYATTIHYVFSSECSCKWTIPTFSREESCHERGTNTLQTIPSYLSVSLLQL